MTTENSARAAIHKDAMAGPVTQMKPSVASGIGVSHTPTSGGISGLSAPRSGPVQMKAADHVQMSWYSGALDLGKGLYESGKGAVNTVTNSSAFKTGSAALNAVMGGVDTYKILDSASDHAEKEASGDYLGAMEEEVDMFESSLDLGSRFAKASGNPWAKAAGTGWGVGKAIGNTIAPYVYGSGEGSRMEDIPEDGIFKPTTGNSVVDWMFGI